jgi:hypothetical protein
MPTECSAKTYGFARGAAGAREEVARLVTQIRAS